MDGAVVAVCVAVAASVTVGFAVITGAFATSLLLDATGVDDDGEPAAAAMPMTNTSPQNTRKPVSALCLAGQGFRPCGPPGGGLPGGGPPGPKST